MMRRKAEGVSVAQRGIKTNVLKRVAANRQRIEEAHRREEREREALRQLNQQPKKEQQR
jgi:hypothetical protein